MFYQSYSNILIKLRQPAIFEPDDIGKSYILKSFFKVGLHMHTVPQNKINFQYITYFIVAKLSLLYTL